MIAPDICPLGVESDARREKNCQPRISEKILLMLDPGNTGGCKRALQF